MKCKQIIVFVGQLGQQTVFRVKVKIKNPKIIIIVKFEKKQLTKYGT